MKKKRYDYHTVNLPRSLAEKIEPYIDRRLEGGLYFKKISKFVFWCVLEKLFELEKFAGDTESVGGVQVIASNYFTPKGKIKSESLARAVIIDWDNNRIITLITENGGKLICQYKPSLDIWKPDGFSHAMDMAMSTLDRLLEKKGEKNG